MSGDTKSGIIDSMSLAERFVALLAAGGLAFTTLQANTIKNSVEHQKSDIEKIASAQKIEIEFRKDQRDQQKQENDLTLEVYKEFISAIKEQTADANTRMDRLSAVLVLTSIISNLEQRQGMAGAVQQSIDRLKLNDPKTIARAEALRFDAEQVIVQAKAEQKPGIEAQFTNNDDPDETKTTTASAYKSPAWDNYDFDIFWCEEQAETLQFRERAEKIATLKSRDPNATGRWRARPLPASVNARSGYQIKGTQIRISSSDEHTLAESLKTVLAKESLGGAVSIRSTSQETPWYLSVFVCE